jgi:hypothetical protein
VAVLRAIEISLTSLKRQIQVPVAFVRRGEINAAREDLAAGQSHLILVSAVKRSRIKHMPGSRYLDLHWAAFALYPCP